MGTWRYMAPEQLDNPQVVDHRADIYSLGVVFYELLTGELPIGRFPAPSQKVQVDVRLDEVVLKALEKEPARRYQHAVDVKTDVDSIAVGKAAAPRVAAGLGPPPPDLLAAKGDVRAARKALTDAINAKDQEVVKLFLDPSFVTMNHFGRVVGGYWQALDMIAWAFATLPDLKQSERIEHIKIHGDEATMNTCRIESFKIWGVVPWFRASRWIETWKRVGDRWLIAA
jgi:hypothetical protein